VSTSVSNEKRRGDERRKRKERTNEEGRERERERGKEEEGRVRPCFAAKLLQGSRAGPHHAPVQSISSGIRTMGRWVSWLVGWIAIRFLFFLSKGVVLVLVLV